MFRVSFRGIGPREFSLLLPFRHVNAVTSRAACQGTACMQTKVMPRAMWALSRILRLRNPVPGNLLLPRQCNAIFTTGPNAGTCAETGELCFGELPEPVPEAFFGDSQCAPPPSTCIHVQTFMCTSVACVIGACPFCEAVVVPPMHLHSVHVSKKRPVSVRHAE